MKTHVPVVYTKAFVLIPTSSIHLSSSTYEGLGLGFRALIFATVAE